MLAAIFARDRDRLNVLVLAVVATTACLAGCDRLHSAPATASKAPSVGVALVAMHEVHEYDEFTGRLEATETVVLRPRVGGYIDKIHFRAGQEVRKGDRLLTIDSRPFRAEMSRAEGELVAARSRAALARSEKARGQLLLRDKAVSQQEFDQLSSTLETAEAAVQAAGAALEGASLNLGYTDIRAPISGRIARPLVTEGNLVAPSNTILTTIESLDRVYAYFDVSEAAFLRFSRQSKGPLRASVGEPVAVRLGLLNEDGYPHPGRIESFDNRLNSETGAIRTRAIFDDVSRQFTPGLYARVRLEAQTPSQAILVPERSIGTDQSKRFVMVVGPDDVASYRVVRLGGLFDGMRAVVDGLRPGERVIVDGLQRVRPGAKVAPEAEASNQEKAASTAVRRAASTPSPRP